jgi:hypothetical protein
MILGRAREQALRSLELPQLMLAIALDPACAPAVLRDDCRKLAYAYEPDMHPTGIDVVPLWEGHSSITAFAAHLVPAAYIQYEVEYIEDYAILGVSPHAITTKLLAWLWTEEGVGDSAVRELAQMFEFPRTDEFLSQLRVVNRRGGTAQKEWERAFRWGLV